MESQEEYKFTQAKLCELQNELETLSENSVAKVCVFNTLY